MGRPSPFIAATQRITNANIGAYILDNARNGRLLDAMVVCPVSLQRWLAERDIPKVEKVETIAELATDSEPTILAADKLHDSHVQAYFAYRLTVAEKRRAGPALGDVSKWREDKAAQAQSEREFAKRRAEIAAKEAEKAAKRKTAPAKPRSEKSCATQAMKEMLEMVSKGKAFDGLWVAARAKQLLAQAK